MKPETLPPISEEELARRMPKRRLSMFSQFLMLVIVFLLLICAAYFVWHFIALGRFNDGVAGISDAGFATTRAEVMAKYVVKQPNPGPLWTKASAEVQTTAGAQRGVPFFDQRASSPPKPGELWPEIENVRGFLQRNAKSLELADRASRMKNPPRYERWFVQSKDGTGATVADHHRLSRLLSLAAFTHAHDGDSESTVTALANGLAVARSLADEPSMLSQHVSSKCLGTSMDAIEKLIEVDFSDEQLFRLQLRIRRLDECSSLMQGMEGETVSAISYLGRPQWPGYERHDESALFVEGMLPLLEATKSGDWSAIGDAAENSVGQAPRDPFGGSNLARNALRGMQSLVITKATSQARLSAIDALLAATRFQLKYGKTPTSLSELVPEFLPAVPIDPFSKTGAPLLFVQNENGTKIYSRGFDAIDDGGEAEFRYSPELVTRAAQAVDIVTELPAP